MTPVQVDPLPLPNPVGVTVKDLNLPTNIGDNASEVNAANDFLTGHTFTLNTTEPINSYTVEGNAINLERPQIKGYIDLSGKTGLYHNFPEDFDQKIIDGGSWANRIRDFKVYNNIGNWFEAPGVIDGTKGIYQIGINEEGIIFNKNFLPLDRWMK